MYLVFFTYVRECMCMYKTKVFIGILLAMGKVYI